MRQSQTFIPTMREIPASTSIVSHQLLLRGGFIRETAKGFYASLPLAQRIVRKISAIIREEMETVQAVEIRLPSLQESDLWKRSARLENMKDMLFHITDQRGQKLLLGPSHEEVVTMLVFEEMKSYKKLPFTLFQLQASFRDENRNDLGLCGSRETMKMEAYSFHANEASCHDNYENMLTLFTKLFTRFDIPFKIVQLNPTNTSHQIVALTEIGDVRFAVSDSSTYAANIDVAKVFPPNEPNEDEMTVVEKVFTPQQKTIQDVAKFLQVDPTKIIKSLVCKVDDSFVLVLCRGDHEINMNKLKDVLHASHIALAAEGEIEELIGCPIGSIGPMKLPIGVKVVADLSVPEIINGICGANEKDYHFINVNAYRDFAIDEVADLRYIQEGDPSPDGQGTIRFQKGIVIGQLDQVGDHMSEALEASFINADGKLVPYHLANYTIDVSRLLSIVAQRHHDDKGLKWPKRLAPYDIHLITVQQKDEHQQQLAEEIYHLLKSYRYDILYDDRPERVGVKFSDSDLIGLPLRITIGKKAAQGIVEVTFRQSGETIEWQKEELPEKLQAFFSFD